MSFLEVCEELERWGGEDLKAGVAALFRVRQSAPRPPGARFAANERGDVVGSVSSGCVEADLYEHIAQVIASGTPRVVKYGITDEQAMEVGLACGGEIEVLVAPYDPGNVVWLELRRVIEARSAAVLVTGLSEGVRARQILLLPDGSKVGTLGDDTLDQKARDVTRSLFDVADTPVIETDQPAATLFAESYLPPPRLAIVGATPVAAALTHLASYLGIAVTVIDPREVFAQPARFPDADRVIRAWPEEGLAEFGLDRWASVVVLAHDRKLDVPALAAALRAGCSYVGQIGGRRTQRLRREALAELGIGEQELARIRGPVGLDIGALSPEEIALSIVAELLAVQRGRAGEPR